MPFFIIFVIIPLMEIMVFMAVGEQIGLFTTLLLALVTAILGGTIVRHQGLQTLLAIKLAFDHGKIPLNEIFDGICLVAAGAMLITPGFITDSLGFALLIPPLRSALREAIRRHTDWHVEHNTGDMRRRHAQDPSIIEGEFEDLDNKDTKDDQNKLT